MQFYVNPYNMSATGFYFETYEELEEKAAKLVDDFGCPIEEFEIEPIDGTQAEMQLAEAANVDPCNIESFIEFINEPEESWPTVYYLMDNLGLSLSDALNKIGDCTVIKSSIEDYAVEFVSDCYLCVLDKDSIQFIESYFDYDKLADDLRANGDCVDFEFGGKVYTCTNANQ
jgi:hypothetical protein